MNLLDGNSDFFAFSTGRRAITSLHTTLTLRPRHDLLQYVFQFLRGFVELNYRVCDEVELDFTFRPTANSVQECVWGVVAKDELKDIKANRWDLVRHQNCLCETRLTSTPRRSLKLRTALPFHLLSWSCQRMLILLQLS